MRRLNRPELQGEFGQRGAGQRILRPALDDMRPGAGLRASMDIRAALLCVDHPELAHIMTRIKLRLQAAIIGERGEGDFDRQYDIGALDLLKLDSPGIDDEVRLDEGVF